MDKMYRLTQSATVIMENRLHNAVADIIELTQYHKIIMAEQ